MNEVSCRGTKLMLEMFERERVPVAPMIEGLPVDEAHLRNPRLRVDWDVWVALLERFVELHGLERLQQLAANASGVPDLHNFQRVGRLLTSARPLYVLNARWAAAAEFRHFHVGWGDLPDGRLELSYSIDRSYRGSTVAFEMVTGLLRGLPRIIGLPEAEVEATAITPHSGRWAIAPPASKTLWARLGWGLQMLRGVSVAAEQLSEQQAEIVAQYQALEARLAEQQRVEQALRRSEDRWRLLAEHAPGVIVVVEGDGRIRSMSRPLGGGAGAPADGGESFFDLLPPERRDEVRAAFERALRVDGATYFELPPSPGPSPWPWYAGRVARLSPDGQGEGFIVLLTDITAQKQAEAAVRAHEERLRQGQKMEALGRLAGGIAHDFNNVLTVVQSYASQLARELPEGSRTQGEARQIFLAGERAASLTRQLLAFTRQQVMRPTVIDMNEVVATLEPMLARMLGEDVRIVPRLGEATGKVTADRVQIEQVLINLALNARDAMPEGGTITIETARVDLDEALWHEPDLPPGSYVGLTFSDTGEGMDRETQARIFEPFFTTKELGKGTGLGLPTVRGIVEQSGGHVWVYSEPGLGTTFRIYLPRVEAAGEAEVPAERPEAPACTAGGSEVILLVEDEAQVRELTRRVLADKGYRVLEAGSPLEALSLSRSHQGTIDLLLTDAVMPVMSGRALARELCAERPGLRVLYMSGYATPLIVSRGVIEQGARLLEKPFTPEALAAAVRGAIHGA